LRQEKIQLEQTLEQEQEYQVNKLMRRIDRLESDVLAKQTTLEQVKIIGVCTGGDGYDGSDGDKVDVGDGNARHGDNNDD